MKTNLQDDGTANSGFKNVTFTDAVLTCEDLSRKRFNNRIRSLTVDDHSSRYENNLFLYKIFLTADMVSEESGSVNPHHINCFVSASNGSVNKFEAFEEQHEEISPLGEDNTNAFGFPRSN